MQSLNRNSLEVHPWSQRQFRQICCCAVILSNLGLWSGCSSTAGVHVWKPASVATPASARVALGPVAGVPELSHRIETALLAQRPAARADVALFTAEQLAESCPIRLVSTASLTSDLTAIHAARSMGADILLQGEILSAEVDLEKPLKEEPKNVNYNELFFAQEEKEELGNENILISWRVIDVESGETLGTEVFNLRSKDAAKQYPDLEVQSSDGTELLIAATARETWKAISPVVVKEEVQLASPWLLPGSFRTRLGVRAAKKGQWEIAQRHWRKVADTFWFNAAAQHNLAIALAAQEDFEGAKEQVQKATGFFARSLPNETLFWLDASHRNYVDAHGLTPPAEGWVFSAPSSSPTAIVDFVEPVEIEDLPWWTALPFAKPPGWTWQDWLRQPIVF